MSRQVWVIITHPDGRTYSVTDEVFARVYETQGFVVDHPERPEDFVADAPLPRRPRRRPVAKPTVPRGKPGDGS